MSIRFKDALKAKTLREFFNEQGRIYLVVDATAEDVVVPDFLKEDVGLRLVLSSRMPQAIHIRDSGVESKFSFSGTAHHCVIPMSRIWAAYHPDADMEGGLFWEEDVPETVRSMMQDIAAQGVVEPCEKVATDNVEAEGTERKVKHLRVVR